MQSIIFQCFMSFGACLAVSVIFNAPRRELLLCGANGALTWFVFIMLLPHTSETIATIAGGISATTFARFASYHRHSPSTLYHIPGIMPLVPGTAMYNSMTYALSGEILETYSSILRSLKVASAIGIGSILVLALPYACFEIFPKRVKAKGKVKG